ncbi:DUF1996 domain-containing protein [Streptomyces antimicrobicus]|uniref:DUF1996 domain-containing protein n=1 Tax=Streptomyces antimicrobicus TaxID=2883108 RepID=A0ABS8BDE5_9ACTN|nr:DUF1996 domain-containing protein [Streptomyces antimicrobicus]MCB5182660.1 DUF1996 domain-containing protein [Streptomyces antimicrobicus]
MSRQGHKRPRLSRKALALVAALTLGAAGVTVVAQQASAGIAGRGGDRASLVTATIDCPDVGDRLREVPDQAKAQVDESLARLDGQVADAYGELASGAATGAQQQRDLLEDLERRRGRTITELADAIGRVTRRPDDLQALSRCRMKQTPPEELAVADEADGTGANGGGADGGGQAQGLAARSGAAPARAGGPSRSDFVAITSVKPNVRRPAPGRNASTGSLSVRCGRNENGHFNPDNVIVAPGVGNGAHHMHDYVGNVSTDAFSTNDSLAAAGTTCTNGDQSTYYWPVLRLRDGRQERDAAAPGGGKDGNVGTILRPKQVTIDFKGSPAGPVTAMPRFLRIITGDAKAFTNGNANANASWSCTGFEDRQLKDKYPVCPQGSDVVRTFTFQSCWDGRNTDSANHRTHVAFADKDGRCKKGFKALPQLVQRIVYGIPQGARFAVDSFPEQLHKPVTDHGDFINVMNDRLMNEAVRCINSGRTCR